MRRANYERANGTVAFGGFLDAERQRVLAAATPERRAQMEAAEESRAVYHAWNTVCSGTREGRHVTGLRYLPESNELLVYLDSPSWTQEMTLLREIIRARMERAGAHVDGLVFKTTAPGHTPPAAKERLRPALGAVTDHGDRLAVQHAEIGVAVMKNLHFLHFFCSLYIRTGDVPVRCCIIWNTFPIQLI